MVVADYKSQANTKDLEPESYLSDPYKKGYKVQMDFYAYLLQQMGFEVEEIAYFLVCNADREADGFNGKMKFQSTQRVSSVKCTLASTRRIALQLAGSWPLTLC